MKPAFLPLLLICVSAATWAQSNPVPLINLPLVPTTAAPASTGFTLTVNGAGFVPSSVVHWSGKPRATQFVSKTQLTATILAADVATAGTASVTVTNPGAANPTSNVAFFSVVASVPTVAFTGSNFPTLGYPVYVAVGDFNNDGNLDLAVANWTLTNSVAILLGKGDGTFRPVVLYPAGAQVGWIAVGDFNGDGKLDLATSNNYANTISILLGNGDGTFKAPVDYATGSSPIGMVAGDFNGDGKLDLAVVSSPFSILLGNGDGTFRAGPAMTAAGYGICTGDFNGDGILDLAVTDFSSNVDIYLGKGDGTFQAPVAYPSGVRPYTVEAIDLNGDGVLDLVVGNYNGASVLLGNRDGTFGSAMTYLTSYSLANGATVADFNGDGIPDIAVGNSAANTISILLGNGDGTFQVFPNVFQSGVYVQGLAVGDFNNDGAMDVALAAFSGSAAYVSLQTNGPAVLFSQATLTFPTQLVGTQSTISILMTNVGKQTLNISQIGTTGSAAHDFSQTNNCGSSVAVGARCDIYVTFAPRNKGRLMAALEVQDNAISLRQSVSLSGTGTWVSLSPSSLTFAKQKVGTVSAAQTITLVNVGSGPVSISLIAFLGGGSSQFRETNNCGTSVAAGGSCTISVQFAPTMTGFLTDILGVQDNGGGGFQKTTVSGTGIL
jgi:hypothetical protein